jgi:hypothetical protein
MQLVEEAIDGCWIGHQARTAMSDSGILDSVYAPPNEYHGSAFTTARRKHVETVVDIEYRPEIKFSHSRLIGAVCLQGWSLKCKKGAIRQVLILEVYKCESKLGRIAVFGFANVDCD